MIEDFFKSCGSQITDKICQNEESQRKLADFEVTTVKQMVWSAAEKWLDKDLVSDYVISAVEQPIEIPFENYVVPPESMRRVKGFADLVGFYAGTELKKFNGARVVLDWKSSRSTFDSKWKSRLIDSWQWRMYAHATGAKLVIYRGVSTDTTAEVKIEVPETNSGEVIEYLYGLWEMRQALIDAKLPVWPRHMPGGCMAFGRQCPFWEDCRNYSMPLKAIDNKDLSYSEAEKFLICPERARRSIISVTQDGSDETHVGTAFHRGIAEVYRIAYGIE